MTAYSEAAFSPSRTLFEETVADLSCQSAAGLAHRELERRFQRRGTELMRLLTREHQHPRAHREARSREPMRGYDGEARTERRPSSRLLGTLFGDVGGVSAGARQAWCSGWPACPGRGAEPAPRQALSGGVGA